ncbi:MAG TPA: serine O-acetyltransferase [Alphaproteobacteria bacterium]|nr:serine O-acetyltransferase [Alphaproteobacteria bacterium]
MFKRFLDHVDSIIARDPAARNRVEVILCYPGLHAVVMHRWAHALWTQGLMTLGRWVSQLARALTGIEIHPSAMIGERLFIDHGMGIVIGSTAVVGDDVTLYQGVTLGGTSLERGVKRHPTLGNNVIVGAGAHILGPITVNDGARVGANAVVLHDVPAGISMIGVPARPVQDAAPAPREFLAYGTPCSEAADPMACMVATLTDQVRVLSERLKLLEQAQTTVAVSRDRLPDAAE